MTLAALETEVGEALLKGEQPETTVDTMFGFL